MCPEHAGHSGNTVYTVGITSPKPRVYHHHGSYSAQVLGFRDNHQPIRNYPNFLGVLCRRNLPNIILRDQAELLGFLGMMEPHTVHRDRLLVLG
jgi:hypothetical protein